ncbi:hypothetical protein LTS08_003614 [Lithohypha guttulata]|nr:hypothetical protein LTS08_003614 [Lithohypha guttulata]
MPRPIELEMINSIPLNPNIKKLSSLAEATQLVEIGPGVYEIELKPDWTYGPRSHGGYLISTVVTAARQECTKKRPDQSDTSSWTTHFLKPGVPGKAEIRTTILSSSSASTIVRAELWQNSKRCVEATVQQIKSQAPSSHVTLPGPEMNELPFHNLQRPITEEMLKAEGWESRQIGEYNPFFKTKPKARAYLPPESDLHNSKHVPHPALGPRFRDTWWTLGEPLDAGSLPVIIDSFLPLHLNFPQGVEYFILTQSISCQMAKKESSKDNMWVFGRAELKECDGRRYIEDVTLFDESGQIIASARQVNVLVPIKNLIGGRDTRKKHAQKL